MAYFSATKGAEILTLWAALLWFAALRGLLWSDARPKQNARNPAQTGWRLYQGVTPFASSLGTFGTSAEAREWRPPAAALKAAKAA
tara:strand:+ start:315 stop:572 length:258 start_codon:yes stop_codon:yes gene_type:complete